MGARRTFEQEWPRLARDLNKEFGRRRIPAALRDDVVQETGVRLFASWHKVDPERSLWGLALTIASHVLWQQSQRKGADLIDDCPDYPGTDDVEGIALARLELSRVWQALSELSAPQQTALLAEIGCAPSPSGTTAALKMLRRRGRLRLHAILERTTAIGCLIRLRADQIRKTLKVKLSKASSGDTILIAENSARLLTALAILATGLSAGSSIAPEALVRNAAPRVAFEALSAPSLQHGAGSHQAEEPAREGWAHHKAPGKKEKGTRADQGLDFLKERYDETTSLVFHQADSTMRSLENVWRHTRSASHSAVDRVIKSLKETDLILTGEHL